MGLSLDAIREDLMPVLGENAVAYSMVTKYVRSEKFAPKNDGPPSEAMTVEPGPVDQAILIVLPGDPFSSVRELSQLICLPRSTVQRRLTDSLHVRIQHLRWIVRLLNLEQKRIRVNMAGELLRVLSIQGARQWHDLATLDESWFDLRSVDDLMWTAPGEIVPDRKRYNIQLPKFMVTIVWNPSGFHVVKAFPKWSKFNAQSDTNNVRGAISDWRRLSGRMQEGKLSLHADNFRRIGQKCGRTISPGTR
jgi:hypothetical protein